jgi:hypothetical protein
VQTVLGHEDLEIAVEFAEFRRRLETQVLQNSVPEVDG